MNLIALDTEDDSKGHGTIFGFYSESGYWSTRSQSEAILYLTSQTDALVWAVNMEYDLVNVFRGYLNLLSLTYTGSRFISGRMRGRKVRFYDLLNHVQASVKKLGEMIGIEKREADYESESYNQRDCEIVFFFVRDYLLPLYGTLGVDAAATLPSVALRYYKKFHLDNDFAFNPALGRVRNFLKSAYFGGRVELFQSEWVTPEKGRMLFSEDVRSMYPAVMRDPLPDPDSGRWAKGWNGETAVVECSLTIPPFYLAPLPVRVEGMLYYPVGNVKGVWNSIELQHALDRGATLNRVYRVYRYDRMRAYLRSFVETIYEKRLAVSDQPVLKKLYKIFSNSLYGKFCQGNTRTMLCPVTEDYSGLTVDGMGFKEIEGPYPDFSNVIWSSWITSLARIKLYGMLQRVENGLCYCDTDSVVYESNQPAFDEGDGLGSVGLEGSFASGYFYAPKFYALFETDDFEGPSRIRVKGVQTDMARAFLFHKQVMISKPMRLRESVKRGEIANFWTQTSKTSRTPYDKKERRGNSYVPPTFGAGEAL